MFIPNEKDEANLEIVEQHDFRISLVLDENDSF